MSDHLPLQISDALLAAMGINCSNIDEDRIPHKSTVVVVSNHRGFLDVPLLMVALGQRIPIACDHDMGQAPVMRVGCQTDGLFLSIKTRI
ncbi:MAG: hypothetical protein F6K26_04155 [Moorea sp. SIO2I5]|nr:hypothetical protein [Moorena sp. SIO2I5]